LDTLRQLLSRDAPNSHWPTAVAGLTITAPDAPTSPRPGIAGPSLGLVIQGGKRTVSGDRVFDYAAGQFLIAQLALPVVGQVTAASAERPFLGIGIRIDPAEIAAMLLEAAATLVDVPARTRHFRRERWPLPPQRPLPRAGSPRHAAGHPCPRAPLPARGALAAPDRAAG